MTQIKPDIFTDIIVIGLGPAGMAVSVMATEMGLKVIAVEKHKIGGECANIGCIPSKGLIKASLNSMALQKNIPEIFKKVRDDVNFIHEKKMKSMFEKIEIIKGEAKFVDKKSVKVEGKILSAKYIFICTGSKPFVPPVEGLKEIKYLTNENVFELKTAPKSLVILGGGAIGCEMAYAFNNLGTKCTIINMDKRLLNHTDEEASIELQTSFKDKGIELYNGEKAIEITKQNEQVVVKCESGLEIRGEKILVAAGRSPSIKNLDLDRAKIKFSNKGIITDEDLKTTNKRIFACGDCNGKVLLSHAAMFQGMLALLSTISFGYKRKFKNYPVPYTVFVQPEISAVGMGAEELKAKNIKFDTIKVKYSDYGSAIAENEAVGFVKAFISPFGKIYGAVIVGYKSGEMINEWALAITNNIKIYDIMLTMHSFPTMGFLTKRVAETWMMSQLSDTSFKGRLMKKLIRWIF
ncbi:MAG: Dihydrolipoyl dehydrogenase [Alphaproteobacteria bacterium ADurb.Bin438]|nr:MAG: Dihydrolipoyl dehydrogenase [Alphaproteobacteria bacterium ADurb.Bin438]